MMSVLSLSQKSSVHRSGGISVQYFKGFLALVYCLRTLWDGR